MHDLLLRLIGRRQVRQMRQPGVADRGLQNETQSHDLIMHRAARRRFVALARLDAMYAVILHFAGRNLAEPDIAEERQQVNPQTDLMSLGPFLRALAVGDQPVFHREPLGGEFEGFLVEEDAGLILAAQPDIPFLGHPLGLVQALFVGGNTVITINDG